MSYFTRGPEAIFGNPPTTNHRGAPSPSLLRSEPAPAPQSVPLQTRSYPPEPTQAEVQLIRDANETRTRAMVEALAHRANPAVPLTERAQPYANMGLLGAARQCLEDQGVRTINLTNLEIAEQALKRRTHSTSDFPLLLEGGVNTAMMAAYKAIPQTFQQFARRDDFPDYRARPLVQLSNTPMPQKVPQGGEYPRGTMVETSETARLEHEGIILGLSLQAIANDNLGALAQIPQRFAVSASLGESRDFYAHLCGNPVMSDSVALFHATRPDGGNTAAGGSLASSAALETAFAWLRKRKDAAGNPIWVMPKFLVVAAALEVAASKLFSSVYVATSPGGTNALDGRSGVPRPIIIVDPHIDMFGSATMHFLIADPNAIETIVYGYLRGREGPQVSSKASFETGGVDFKLTNDFGVKAAEWRSMYQLT